MEWRDTTIIIKFNVIIFVRLEQWNFLVAIVNNVFKRWRVVFESLLNFIEFLVARSGANSVHSFREMSVGLYFLMQNTS